MDLVFFAVLVLYATGLLLDAASGWRRRSGPSRAPGSSAGLLARALAAAPALWIVGFALLVTRAWLRIGERPSGSARFFGSPFSECTQTNIDPGVFSAHYSALVLGLFAVPVAMVAAWGLWASQRGWRDPAIRARAALTFASGIALWVIVAHDLGGFWNWFMD